MDAHGPGGILYEDIHPRALLIHGRPIPPDWLDEVAAVDPYLALATVAHLGRDTAPDNAIKNYLHAIEHGLLKIMSKMGISTVDAYCGAQIFEIIGLGIIGKEIIHFISELMGCLILTYITHGGG
jgi:hypothetical protein